MNHTTIADIEELANKSPVNSLSAAVKKAFPATEGEGQYGPWRMQAAILKDESGEIRATFWDRFNLDLRNLEGEDITVTSGRDKKGNFSGITADDYKGKRQIRIAKEASLGDVAEQTEEEVSGGAPYSEVLSNPVSVPTKRFVSEETKRASIEKQAALKDAVAYCSAAGLPMAEVIKIANEFYGFLHGEPEVI